MKEIKVTVNTWYVVEGAAGATVINPLTNRAIATVEDGKQASFLATTPYVVASDDSVSVFKAPFNSAPAKLKLLGLLGGGVSTGGELPKEYLRAEFLESAPQQWINTLYTFNETSGARVDYKCLFTTTRYVAGSGNPRSFIPTSTVGRRSYAWNGSYYHMGGVFLTEFSRALGSINYMGDKLAICIDEVETIKKSVSAFSPTAQTTTFALFRESPKDYSERMQIFSAQISENEDVVRDFIPALDNTGTPCMYDKVTKQTFRNSGTGSFIVGMTLEQARKLGKLPAGTKLTVSLPVGYDADEGVANARAQAQENGCVLTVQTYEAEVGAASTFALRRIWVRKTQDENGTYIAGDGTRWQVDWCVEIIGADPEQEGYELFRSVEAACEYWGLTPYVSPEGEEDFLTETN